jgi:hypothetical protein
LRRSFFGRGRILFLSHSLRTFSHLSDDGNRHEDADEPARCSVRCKAMAVCWT